MRRRTGLAVAAVLGVLIAPVLLVGQSADPFVGLWKMNVAKSQFQPGPALESRTLRIEPAGSGLKAIHDGVEVGGRSFHSENLLRLDGQEHPSETAPNATSMTRRLDALNIQSITRVNGAVTLTVRMELSADRKTWTTTQRGTNAQGQAVHNIWVYERQ